MLTGSAPCPSYDACVRNPRHTRCVRLVLFALLLPGCGGDDNRAGTGAPLCSPRSAQPPCTNASVEVDYRIRISTHCGVNAAYLDGRWWRIDPPQPEGASWIAGTARLLDSHELVFHADDGRRYAFAPAPSAFAPPSCY